MLGLYFTACPTASRNQLMAAVEKVFCAFAGRDQRSRLQRALSCCNPPLESLSSRKRKNSPPAESILTGRTPWTH